MLWFKITLCSFKCVTLPPGGSGWSTTAYIYILATISAVCIMCTVCIFSEYVEHCVPQCNVPPISSGRNEPKVISALIFNNL